MHLIFSLIFLNLFFSSTVLVCQANPSQEFYRISEKKESHNGENILKGIIETDDEKFEEEIKEDLDFIDEDFTELSAFDSENNLNSVTHLHQSHGEILVPCFGMWWPVGGSSYDYYGDYYGDYKKRRRSRKKKKAAKTRKRKKAKI